MFLFEMGLLFDLGLFISSCAEGFVAADEVSHFHAEPRTPMPAESSLALNNKP